MPYPGRWCCGTIEIQAKGDRRAMATETAIEQKQKEAKASDPLRESAAAPSHMNSANEGSHRTALLVALALIATTAALYARTLHDGFISYDDYDYISSNPLVRGGLSWHGIAQAFTSTDQANWFPMEWISLMGTSQFFGVTPWAYHLTNLALHCFNVALLFLLLYKATDRMARSATVAALFAVFPLNVEAVAWATERKSVLSVFFLLLALAGYGWYVRKPSSLRYIAVAAPLALGLMTKAWLVTAPFALLLLDYWPLQRFDRAGPSDSSGREQESALNLVLEKIPLFLMAFATTAMGVYAARTGGAFAIATAHAPFSLRFENALWSYFAYVLKALWPAHLAILYPFPLHLFPWRQMAAAATFLLGVTGLAWALRKKRYLLIGWLWFLGILFPVIGLIQTGTQSMADRWAYLSFVGLFVAAVWGIADLAENLHLPRVALSAVTGIVLGAYGWIAFVQAGYWLNSFTLLAHAVEVTKANGPARVNLGVEYEHAGRPDLAFEQYEQAIVDTPNLSTAHFNLARMLDQQQRPIEAASEYQQTIANTNVAHEIAEAHTGLGTIYFNMNLPEKALDEFSAALAADPAQVYPRIDRGMIEYREGKLEGAREDFTRAVQILPTPMTWFTLGRVLEDQKNWGAAVSAYRAALQMNPNLPDAQAHLQTALQQISR
jgi:tetratricopeptide (TPR) repeat protein